MAIIWIHFAKMHFGRIHFGNRNLEAVGPSFRKTCMLFSGLRTLCTKWFKCKSGLLLQTCRVQTTKVKGCVLWDLPFSFVFCSDSEQKMEGKLLQWSCFGKQRRLEGQLLLTFTTRDGKMKAQLDPPAPASSGSTPPSPATSPAPEGGRRRRCCQGEGQGQGFIQFWPNPVQLTKLETLSDGFP